VVDEPRDSLSEVGGGPPVGLAAFDGALRYVAVNGWLAELNGISVEEHIGRTMREVVPELADQLEPAIRATFDGGEPVYGRRVPQVSGARAANRSTIASTCWPTARAKPSRAARVGVTASSRR
jgi:PAS domain-containing protein